MTTISVEVKGLKETQAEMERIVRDLNGPPFLQGMRDATMLVTASAKQLAPVDTGRLRASITPEVRMMGNETVGVVGSNVVYAPYVEFGTRPHWAPFRAFEVWAKRHGLNEAEVWWAVGLKGTKAHPYLVPAFEQNTDKIFQKLGECVGRIVR